MNTEHVRMENVEQMCILGAFMPIFNDNLVLNSDESSVLKQCVGLKTIIALF